MSVKLRAGQKKQTILDVITIGPDIGGRDYCGRNGLVVLFE